MNVNYCIIKYLGLAFFVKRPDWIKHVHSTKIKYTRTHSRFKYSIQNQNTQNNLLLIPVWISLREVRPKNVRRTQIQIFQCKIPTTMRGNSLKPRLSEKTLCEQRHGLVQEPGRSETPQIDRYVDSLFIKTLIGTNCGGIRNMLPKISYKRKSLSTNIQSKHK